MEKDLIQQPSLCKRIAFVGPESTGKTTLSERMPSYTHTGGVRGFFGLTYKGNWVNNGVF